MYKNTLLVITLALLVASCATTQTQVMWRHNSLKGAAAQQQFTADNGLCTGEAYRAIGAPPVFQNAQPQTDTRFSGRTSGGANFEGNATTTYSDPNPFMRAWRESEVQSQYESALYAVFVGCMARRGWSQHTVKR